MKHLKHNISPIFNKNSKILILGSFPSPKSRENEIFYGNPQNRFWLVLAKLFNEPTPETKTDKIDFLLKHKIALWDVVEECIIQGASDCTIKDAKPNDLNIIFKKAKISAVFTTGKTATKLYKQFFNKESIYLPSPSPANFAYNFKKLVVEYSKILKFL